MLIDVSYGEALDKLSILEIKQQFITNVQKANEVKKEYLILIQSVDQYKQQVQFLYQLLKFINQCLWHLTDDMKTLNINEPRFSLISHTIFEHNQYRFRVKNMINHKLCILNKQDGLKEQKSYNESCIKFSINEFTFFRYIYKIFQASVLYDQVIIYYDHFDVNSRFLQHAKIICNTPNFIWKDIATKVSNDVLYSLDDWQQSVFVAENQPIFQPDLGKTYYVNGGFLGDFINSLGVCSTDFWQTGRKCVVYISATHGDQFRFSLQETYSFTKDLVLQQPYVCQYEMYSNQSFDVNLSLFRTSKFIYKASWDVIYDDVYQIKGYGKYPWIEVSTNNDAFNTMYKNTLLINYSTARAPTHTDYNLIRSIQHQDKKYLALDDKQADAFMHASNIKLDRVKVNTALELCQILHSCYCFIGNLSSPLAFATAMHKFCFGLSTTIFKDTVHMQELNVKNYSLLVDQNVFDNDKLNIVNS